MIYAKPLNEEITGLFTQKKSIAISMEHVLAKSSSCPLARSAQMHGYEVYVLTIENQSPYQFELREENVDLSLIDHKEMLRFARLGALPRIIAYKIIGLFFWPMMIPSFIDGCVTMEKTHLLKRKLYASCLKKEGEILIPYSTMKRYVYLQKKEIPKIFTLKLFNCHTFQNASYKVGIPIDDNSHSS